MAGPQHVQAVQQNLPVGVHLGSVPVQQVDVDSAHLGMHSGPPVEKRFDAVDTPEGRNAAVPAPEQQAEAPIVPLSSIAVYPIVAEWSRLSGSSSGNPLANPHAGASDAWSISAQAKPQTLRSMLDGKISCTCEHAEVESNASEL